MYFCFPNKNKSVFSLLFILLHLVYFCLLPFKIFLPHHGMLSSCVAGSDVSVTKEGSEFINTKQLQHFLKMKYCPQHVLHHYINVIIAILIPTYPFQLSSEYF